MYLNENLPKEFALNKTMPAGSNEGEVVSRFKLLDEIWGYDVYTTTRTVDNFILNIRKKIEDDPSHPKHLLTVHNSGYKFFK